MQTSVTIAAAAVLGVLGGCATVPPPHAEVVSLRADALPQQPGLPPAGTTWRLDENELQTLSPAPYVAPPPLLLPYPVPGAALPPPPPPVYAPYVAPPLFYFGLGYTWGGHRHWSGHPHRFRSWRR